MARPWRDGRVAVMVMIALGSLGATCDRERRGEVAGSAKAAGQQKSDLGIFAGGGAVKPCSVCQLEFPDGAASAMLQLKMHQAPPPNPKDTYGFKLKGAEVIVFDKDAKCYEATISGGPDYYDSRDEPRPITITIEIPWANVERANIRWSNSKCSDECAGPHPPIIGSKKGWYGLKICRAGTLCTTDPEFYEGDCP